MHKSVQHVLCVDDEGDILDVARMCLELVGGLRVSCCSSGREALDFVNENVPDLVLLDVMMPGLDGPATLKEMRSRPKLDAMPIVFMTARVQPAEVQAYKASGATGVVPKPFDPMTLASQINDIWTKYHEQHYTAAN
jgi:CheY-like chemotaxis protein